MYAKVKRSRRKLIYVNTIDLNVESYQFKTTMVKCIDVQLKGLKIITIRRRDVDIANMYVTQIINILII